MKNSSAVTQLFGRDLLAMTESVRDRWIQRAVYHWRDAGFPYPRLSNEEIVREFRLLRIARACQILKNNESQTATTGLRLANFFHPQMWDVRSQQHRLSPIDFFNDDSCLRKALSRAPRFWPNRRCWNAQCVRSLFRIYSSGRVANFRPLVARAIVDRFSGPGNVVLDFCAGFGGRLLGTLTLKRHYVGVDPCSLQTRGLRNMIESLKNVAIGTAEIHENSAEEFLEIMPAKSVDLVFSSPPYYDTEIYSEELTQSVRRYRTYHEWLESFLQITFQHAHRILRPNRFFVVNVADNRRFQLQADALRIARPLFGTPKIVRMMMRSRPLQQLNKHQQFRWEPLFIFRKSLG